MKFKNVKFITTKWCNPLILDNESENNGNYDKKENFCKIDLTLRNELTEELKDNTFEVNFRYTHIV